MIDLYTWTTSNGRRPLIVLEETGLPYRIIPINIQEGDQRTPEYIRISPYSKIPSMIDQDGPDGEAVTMFESCAILVYLADKAGQFIGSNAAERARVLSWLTFSAAGLIPTTGAMRTHEDMIPQAERQLDVLDARLADSQYVAGDYSIADMAPATRLAAMMDQQVVRDRPNVVRWMNELLARPAVKKALEMEIKK